MNRRYDENDLRELFGEVDPPPGVAHWRDRVKPKPSVFRGAVRARSIRIALAASVVAILVISVYAALRQETTSHSPDAPRAGASPGPATTGPADPGPDPTLTLPVPGITPGGSSPRPSPPTPSRRPGTSTTTRPVPPPATTPPNAPGLHITVAGTTVDGATIRGSVVVDAPDVTIVRTTITADAGSAAAVRQTARGSRLILEDVTIAGTPSSPAAVGVLQEAAGLTVVRTTVRTVRTGLQLAEDASVVNSTIDGLAGSGDLFGVLVPGGAARVSVLDSRIVNPSANGAAIALLNDQGDNAFVEIRDNVLAGGRYTVRLGSSPRNQEIRLISNTVSPEVFPAGGELGPVEPLRGRGSGYEWTDNTFADGTVIPPPIPRPPGG